jgi:hypothetical protein
MPPDGEAGAPAPLLIGGTRTELGAGAKAAFLAANKLRIASVFATGGAGLAEAANKVDPEGVGVGIEVTEFKNGLLSSVDISLNSYIYNNTV